MLSLHTGPMHPLSANMHVVENARGLVVAERRSQQLTAVIVTKFEFSREEQGHIHLKGAPKAHRGSYSAKWTERTKVSAPSW